MPAKKYHVALTTEERDQLQTVVRSTKTSIRERTHARILLLADTNQEGGACQDEAICAAARTSASTVERVRQRCTQDGLDAALFHKPQEKRKGRALDGVGEAHLIAVVCGDPPEGRKRWSLRLLQEKLIEMQVVDTISHEAVRTTLKKMNLNRG